MVQVEGCTVVCVRVNSDVALDFQSDDKTLERFALAVDVVPDRPRDDISRTVDRWLFVGTIKCDLHVASKER